LEEFATTKKIEFKKLGKVVSKEKGIDIGIEELFGENQGMFIVSISPTDSSKLEEFATTKKIEFKKLGKVVSKEKGIDIGTHKFDLEELNNIYFNSIPNILEDNRC